MFQFFFFFNWPQVCCCSYVQKIGCFCLIIVIQIEVAGKGAETVRRLIGRNQTPDVWSTNYPADEKNSDSTVHEFDRMRIRFFFSKSYWPCHILGFSQGRVWGLGSSRLRDVFCKKLDVNCTLNKSFFKISPLLKCYERKTEK